MALMLYGHPLASFCHKVLVALYENGTPFENHLVDLADEAQSAELQRHWAVGKIPVLRDTGRDCALGETSIIIEYLDHYYPGPAALIPKGFDEALQARLWDRFFDLYVSVPMQRIVGERLRPQGQGDPFGVAEARKTLAVAYDMVERQMQSHTWSAGESFSIADCSAAPALFYAGIVQPFGPGHDHLRAYFQRLEARSSFQRTLAEAQPYFGMFPYREAMPARFLEGLG